MPPQSGPLQVYLNLKVICHHLQSPAHQNPGLRSGELPQGSEHKLLLHRTQVQVPATTSGSSQQPVNSSSYGSDSIFRSPRASGTQMVHRHPDKTHTCKIKIHLKRVKKQAYTVHPSQLFCEEKGICPAQPSSGFG